MPRVGSGSDGHGPRARRGRTHGARVVVACVLGLTAGCGEASDGPAPGAAAVDAPVAGPVLVSAAASLSDAFADMAAAFEAAHPDSDVVLNLAGSSSLRLQIDEGAPVDVFAAADTAHTGELARAGRLAGEAHVFATNRLRVAVPRGNPARVVGLEDLGRQDLLVGLCAPTVPCGALARRVLARAGVSPASDTDEPDVRALLTKIGLGELDVGLVYATDVAAAADRVDGIDVPTGADLGAHYAIAVVAGAPNPASAVAFTAFVRAPDGQAILARHGFGAP